VIQTLRPANLIGSDERTRPARGSFLSLLGGLVRGLVRALSAALAAPSFTSTESADIL